MWHCGTFCASALDALFAPGKAAAAAAAAAAPTCSSNAWSATRPTSTSLSARSERHSPHRNTCLSNYSTQSPGPREETRGPGKEKDGERGRESNLKWSDRGQLARDLQGSGRECVEVKARLP